MGGIPKHICVAYDTCAFWPPDAVEREAALELLALLDPCHIPVEKTQAVDEELNQAPARVRRIANELTCLTSYDMFNTEKERRDLLKVQRMLFGTRADLRTGDLNDARNLLCSSKYSHTFFVTFGKRHLLSKGSEIRARLNLEVVTPSQCLALIKDFLRSS